MTLDQHTHTEPNMHKAGPNKKPLDNMAYNETKKASIPAKFLDPETGEIRLDAFIKSYQELERKLSQSVPNNEEGKDRVLRSMGRPDTPEDYCIDCGHGLFDIDLDINRRLHSKGMTQEQVQEVYDLAAEKLVPMVSDIAADFKADREVEKLINHFGGKEQWKRISKQIFDFGHKNLQHDVFESLAQSHDGILALYRMMTNDEPSLNVKADQGGADSGKLELEAMMRDPKYWKEKDPAFIAKVTEGFKNMYGE